MHRDPVLDALGKIARIVSETLELRDVLVRVAKEAAAVLPLEGMTIARLEDSGALTLYSHTGDISDILPAVTFEDFSPALRPSLKGVKRVDDANALADPAFYVDREMLKRESRALMTVPLHRGDWTAGFVAVDSRGAGSFTAEHEVVLLSIADLLSLALEHERLWSLDLVRRRRLDTIDAVLPVIANALDVREIFEQVSQIVRPVLPHDHLLLLSISADEHVMNVDAYSGDFSEGLPPSAPVEESKRFPVGQEFHLIHDVQDSNQWRMPADPVAKALGIRSVLRIPIYLEGVPESTLNFLSRTPSQYSEDDVSVARRVADHVSLALSHRRLAEEERRAALLEQRVESLTQELETTLGIRRVVGRSKKWKAALAQVAKVAPTETSVLLTGESGTGKEVLARMIHRGSPRSKGPFVAINCAALPETLLESELFGHEKGAFTGASRTRLGCIEQAAGGILFLDEVGELSLAAQAKLLRVLEQREFTRVGGARTIQADVRLVAATNRNLKTALTRGGFREDLYYRLRVFEIALPPLRERSDDILPLAGAFLEEIGRTVGRPAGGLSRQVQEALLAYPWPGNARELRNVLERATILCGGGLIALDHLPPEVGNRESIATNSDTVLSRDGYSLDGAERDLIIKALQQTRNNRTKAAHLLGITRPTLYYKMQKFGLTSEPDPRSEGSPER